MVLTNKYFGLKLLPLHIGLTLKPCSDNFRLNDSLGMGECLFMAGKSVYNSDYAQTSTLLQYMKEKCETALVVCGGTQIAADQMRESLSNLQLVKTLEQISRAKQER